MIQSKDTRAKALSLLIPGKLSYTKEATMPKQPRYTTNQLIDSKKYGIYDHQEGRYYTHGYKHTMERMCADLNKGVEVKHKPVFIPRKRR